MASLRYRQGRLAMIRFVADIIGHISTFVETTLPGKQVGEVAPAPRLDVLVIMTTRQ